MLWLWCRPAAAALIHPQAWEFPYAADVVVWGGGSLRNSVPSAFFFCLFKATPVAYGDSQPRSQIGAVAASYSHRNVRSEPHLGPTPQFMATLNP